MNISLHLRSLELLHGLNLRALWFHLPSSYNMTQVNALCHAQLAFLWLGCQPCLLRMLKSHS